MDFFTLIFLVLSVGLALQCVLRLRSARSDNIDAEVLFLEPLMRRLAVEA